MVFDKDEFAEKSAQYLETYDVYDIFQDLLQKLIVARPANPIDFLCNCLQDKATIKICIIAPPGCNRKQYSKMVANDFQLEYINVGEMLSKDHDVSKGVLVPDEAVIAAVNKRLSDLSPAAGFVLDGYPRTKVQATALQLFLPDKIILLNASETTIKQRYAEKGVGGSDVIHRRLQHHFRHIAGVAEVFKNILGQVDARSEDSAAIYEQLKKMIHLRVYSNAPLRPPRICIVGPPGIGKTEQAKIVAKSFGCVRIDVHALFNENGSPTSDAEICAIVGDRLQQVDCVRRGWLLDGFPMTLQQAQFLKKTYWPTRVVQLIGSEAACLKRLSQRKIDPATGDYYYGLPKDPNIRARLVQAEMDHPTRVRARYDIHCNLIADIMVHFERISMEVRGDLTVDKVADLIDSFLRRPTPTDLTQVQDNSMAP
eukprot:GEMP01050288.1.p1 GENE.GEMP01050288.1~~GEMP01050288.1.p1  ORF type:complete len:426 (+),score=84.26 GEMP01050288.1:52-1329(+)